MFKIDSVCTPNPYKSKKYLIFNNLLKLTNRDIQYLFSGSDLETIDYLFGRYPPTQDELSFIVRHLLGYLLGTQNSKIQKYLLNYRHSINGNVVQLNKNQLKKIMSKLHLFNLYLNGKELEDLYNRIYSGEPGCGSLYSRLNFISKQNQYLLDTKDIK